MDRRPSNGDGLPLTKKNSVNRPSPRKDGSKGTAPTSRIPNSQKAVFVALTMMTLALFVQNLHRAHRVASGGKHWVLPQEVAKNRRSRALTSPIADDDDGPLLDKAGKKVDMNTFGIYVPRDDDDKPMIDKDGNMVDMEKYGIFQTDGDDASGNDEDDAENSESVDEEDADGNREQRLPSIPVAITTKDDEALALDKDGRKLHMVFISSYCGDFDDWTSYLFFYSAFKVRQPGRVTMILSACRTTEATAARRWFRKHIKPMSDRFGLYIAPAPPDSSAFKPFCLDDFLKNGEGMGDEEAVIILMERAMNLQRPILADFSNDQESIAHKEPGAKSIRTYKVEHGTPFAQIYLFGAKWRSLDLDAIVGPDSPAKLVSESKGTAYYQAGPPFIATAKDMRAIASKWAEIMPKVLAQDKGMGEIYSYAIAAAHLKLPHKLMESLMVSNANVPQEGWPFVDKLPRREVCEFATNVDHTAHAVPSTIHFCQDYEVKSWSFHRGKIPTNVFSCESDFLPEPPPNTFRKDGKGARNLFVICAMLSQINDAAEFYKSRHCPHAKLRAKQSIEKENSDDLEQNDPSPKKKSVPNELQNQEDEAVRSNRIQKKVDSLFNAARTTEFDPTDKKTKLHLVFSTDCNPMMHWQSYIVFYSALRAGQHGHVTRIASGCSEEDTERTKDWHDKYVKAMSDRFHVHFTPPYEGIVDAKTGKKKTYMYMNKPWGLLHWLENGEGEGLGLDKSTGKIMDEDAVIILMDPDFVLLRPMSVTNLAIPAGVRTDESETVTVEHGKPFAQEYGFGASWVHQFNMTKVTGDPRSPAHNVTSSVAEKRYAVGPPYFATARDMYAIVRKWVQFTPETVKKSNGQDILAEMYGYCIAAAHLNLPHTLIKSYMVSSPRDMVSYDDREGFNLVDRIPGEDMCNGKVFAQNLAEEGSGGSGGGHSGFSNELRLPSVIHYCQGYKAGPSHFTKYRFPSDFFSCGVPLLVDPPTDLGSNEKYSFKYKNTGKSDDREDLDPRVAKRMAFMICGITTIINEAAEVFKHRHCGGVEETRWDRTLHVSMMDVYPKEWATGLRKDISKTA